MLRRGAAVLAVAALAAGALVLGHGASATPSPTCSWPMYGHDPGHSFATAPGCTALSSTNAFSLVPQWWLPTPEPVTASPTVVDGTIYVGDWAGTFYAVPTTAPGLLPIIQAPTPRWTFQVDDTDGVAFGRITSTAAVVTVGGRKVVVFGGGATLYVLDAANGHRLASTCLDPRSDPTLRCKSSVGHIEIESSPTVLVAGDGQSAQVLVGMDVHNDANVGRTGLVSLGLSSDGLGGYALTPQWKLDPENATTYTGPGLLTQGAGTGQGCGGVWSSPAVDVQKGLVFFGTSSCSADGPTSGESAWGADLATGAVRWQYRPPRQSLRWDDDFGASPNLLPGGLVGFGSKDGWYYAVRGDTTNPAGQLAWASHLGESGHLEKDFAVGGIIGTPAVGTVKGQPAIFATTALSTPILAPLNDGFSLDTSLLTDPLRLLSLTAIRASDGAVLWRSPLPRQSYAAPSFANGVVLVPSTFGLSLSALRADDGLPLSHWVTFGPPASAAEATGNPVIMGLGTSETDLEFKALGMGALDALAPIFGSSPISRLSGIEAFQILLP
jgi:polyvinyl alcohol dehydrogenase (cytochrome)